MKYFSLIVTTISSTLVASYVQDTGNLYLKQYVTDMLINIFDGDSEKLDKVMNHGCFCAKMDISNPNQSLLGGTNTIDELDELCRNWLRCRNCNDNLINGSCKEDRATMKSGSYEIDGDTCINASSGCEMDTCLIDKYYAYDIRDFIENNPTFNSTQIVSAGTCNPSPKSKANLKCEGSAPYLTSSVHVLSGQACAQHFRSNILAPSGFGSEGSTSVQYDSGSGKYYVRVQITAEFNQNRMFVVESNKIASFTVENGSPPLYAYMGWVKPGTYDPAGNMLGGYPADYNWPTAASAMNTYINSGYTTYIGDDGTPKQNALPKDSFTPWSQSGIMTMRRDPGNVFSFYSASQGKTVQLANTEKFDEITINANDDWYPSFSIFNHQSYTPLMKIWDIECYP